MVKESDLFEPLYNYFTNTNWEVFSEVEAYYGYKRADIICRNEKQLIAIEMKTSLSMDVMEQAINWVGSADFIFVAIPKKKREHSWLALSILKQYGIGLIEIDLVKYGRLKRKGFQEESTKAEDYALKMTFGKKHEVTKKRTFSRLLEEHKTWAVGGSTSKGSKYVTPYALVMNDAYAYLRQELDNMNTDGWVTAKMIWEHLKENSKPIVRNHYKDPVRGITQAFRKYEDGDIEEIKIGRTSYYRIMDGSEKYLNLGKVDENEKSSV